MPIARPYQVEADDASEHALTGPRRRALVQAATGTGKTVIIAMKAERWRPRGRSVVFVHREELGEQAAAQIESNTLLTVGIEQADRRVSALPDVVVASTPTLLTPARRERFGRDAFALAIADECHHYAIGAGSFSSVPGYFSAAAQLGVTATPYRMDGLPLFHGEPVFRYGIRVATTQGYLVPIRRVVQLLPELKLQARTGDWTDAELERELAKAPAVAAAADAIVKHAGDRPTVVFCAGIIHSKLLAAALCERRPGCATHASGEERAGVAELKAGKVQILCNADLTIEGFDFPPLSCVVRLRPTKSLGRATQQTGRGTRPSEETGKRDLLVIEFMGAGASDQVRTIDVVGPDFTERARTLAEQMLSRDPALTVLDALERAAALTGGATTAAKPGAILPSTRPVLDPLRVILSLDGMVLEEPLPGAMPATPEQIVKLAGEGLRVAGLSRRQAAMLLQGVQWRREHREHRWKAPDPLSTPAQALRLYQYGYPLEITAREANRLLAPMGAAHAAR